jgi:predicted RNase H-like HicB family nuclease
MTAEEYLKRPYTRILIPNESGGYSAEILEFPGCFAQGETADETMENLSEAAVSWIEACQEQNIDIPEPSMNQGFGGKIALRLPRSLHRQVVRMAERDNVSVNQFLVAAIAAKVGADEFYQKVMKQFQSRLETTVRVFMDHANFAVNVNNTQFGFSVAASNAQVAGTTATSFGNVGQIPGLSKGVMAVKHG